MHSSRHGTWPLEQRGRHRDPVLCSLPARNSGDWVGSVRTAGMPMSPNQDRGEKLMFDDVITEICRFRLENYFNPTELRMNTLTAIMLATELGMEEPDSGWDFNGALICGLPIIVDGSVGDGVVHAGPTRSEHRPIVHQFDGERRLDPLAYEHQSTNPDPLDGGIRAGGSQ